MIAPIRNSAKTLVANKEIKTPPKTYNLALLLIFKLKFIIRTACEDITTSSYMFTISRQN